VAISCITVPFSNIISFSSDTLSYTGLSLVSQTNKKIPVQGSALVLALLANIFYLFLHKNLCDNIGFNKINI
jgi:hypothetical protein